LEVLFDSRVEFSRPAAKSAV